MKLQHALIHDQAEKDSQELSAELDGLREKISVLHGKAKEAETKWQETSNKAANFEHIVQTLSLKREKEEWLQSNVKQLSQDLKQRTESTEWLQSELDQFEERVTGQEQNKAKMTTEFESLRRSIDKTRETLRALHVEAGKFEEQKDNHEQMIEKRKMMIRETSREHNIRGFEHNLNDAQIEEYLDKIRRLCKDQNAAVDRVRRETDSEMQKAQETLNRLGERRTALNEGKSSSKEQIASNDTKISASQAELNKIEVDEGSSAVLEAKVDSFNSELKRAKQEFESASWDQKISDGNTRLTSYDEEIRQLNRDVARGTKQAAELGRLDHLKKEINDRQRSLEKMKVVNSERFRALVDPGWDTSTLEQAFQDAVNEKSRALTESQNERDQESRRLEQIDFRYSTVGADMTKSQKESKRCEDHIREMADCEPEAFQVTVQGLEDDRDVLRGDKEGFKHRREYFQQAIKTAQDSHKCKLCIRPFQGREQQAFLHRMEQVVAQKALEEIEAQFQSYEDTLQKAKAATSSYDTWIRLTTTEIPHLEDQSRELVFQRSQCLEKVERFDDVVRRRKEEKNDLDILKKPVDNIARCIGEIKSFSEQVSDLAAKQKDAGLSRTLEEIQEQLDITNGKSQTLRNAVAKLNADKASARSHISTLDLDLSKAEKNLDSAAHQLEKKASILGRIEELRIANQKHTQTIQKSDEQLRGLVPRISEEEAKREDLRQRGGDKENLLQQEASRLSDSVNRLRHVEQSIQQYAEVGGPAKLAKSYRDIESAQQDIKRVEEEQKMVIVTINKIDGELRNHKETKRTIEDNIKYRRSLQELEVLRTEIAKLSAQNAEADQARWFSEAHRWHASLTGFQTEKTSQLATAKAKDDMLQKLLTDWETDFKDAAGEFKMAHIQVETTKAAIEDLGRYAGALDKAIMKYHGMKMEEINRIVDELWKKTYQGTDVDTIKIRSDHETMKGNRSYNYRVVMMKQDAEMDMRGRCSAGQKVLASIIIRLALAECFGVNCGMIALDEPTTNLDRDNIESLARALHDIILARQHQANFQLIVITHDEDFLRYMRCPDFCDIYWRVSRNNEQKSIIRQQEISMVM